MTDQSILFEKLEQQGRILEKQTQELSCIKQAIIDIKVQGTEIIHLNNQLSALWKKYDDAFGPEGTIAKLNAKAAACPEKEVKKALNQQWVAIGLIVALIGALKIWG